MIGYDDILTNKIKWVDLAIFRKLNLPSLFINSVYILFFISDVKKPKNIV